VLGLCMQRCAAMLHVLMMAFHGLIAAGKCAEVVKANCQDVKPGEGQAAECISQLIDESDEGDPSAKSGSNVGAMEAVFDLDDRMHIPNGNASNVAPATFSFGNPSNSAGCMIGKVCMHHR